MKQKSILVLDDDADLTYTFQIALEIEGFKVVAFHDPVEAIEYFKTNSSNFCLIITDMKMPKMNGIEFASMVREIDKNIRIWLISSYLHQDIRYDTHFISASFEKVIEKPVSIGELVNMVKSAVN